MPPPSVRIYTRESCCPKLLSQIITHKHIMSVVLKSILLLSCVVVAVSAGGVQVAEDNPWWKSSCKKCPTDPTYSSDCLSGVIPPFPICCGRDSAKEWVEHAKDAATRCCVDDMSKCKCPIKEEHKFQDKIGAYCSAVVACSSPSPQATSTEELVVNNLRGGFDMEMQIQREEYAP